MGLIYCGDNLEVLSEYIPRESVDLIYLDPPFNSQRTYNLIYKDQRAQEEAFKDYWSWEEAAPTFHKLTTAGQIGKPLRTLMKALHDVLIDNDSDQLAYLTMMAPRLVALHRVLKSNGSLYLHCDPTASHYLKLILDTIFGANSFANEIVWRRTNARRAEDRWPRMHDILLFYRKGERSVFHRLEVVADEAKMPHTLITGPDGEKYQTYELTAPNLRHGETGKPWRGFQPATMGRCWANPPAVMDQWDKQGLIHWPKKKGAWPRRRAAEPFRPENRMVTVGDVWTDIDRLNQTAKERLRYPTQKPLALLSRIVEASSKPGDVVLDPFCGCGTTIEAAEALGRRWIGIDIARKAIEVIEGRFKKVGLAVPDIVWHPADAQSADALASRNKLQFEKWVLRKIRAVRLRKKDRGIDGEAFFKLDARPRHVVVSVKGGRHLPPSFARDLRGVIEREKSIGVLVSLVEPGKEMKLEAARAGFLPESDAEGPIPRLQLVTVNRLFSDLPPIRCPGENVTEMPKPSVPSPAHDAQLSLDLDPGAKRRPKGQPIKPPREAIPARVAAGSSRPPRSK